MKVGSEEHLLALTKATLLLLDLESDRLMRGRAQLEAGEPAIRQRISQVLGKNPILHKRVDESIIGGLVVRVGDKVMDASVKTQLKSMRERLLASGA